MAVYPIFKVNKEGTVLRATNSYYSREYAERMCELYLTDELYKNEQGKVKKYYRLNAKNMHTPEMALAYDVDCPSCKNRMKQVGRQLSANQLGLYNCPICNKQKEDFGNGNDSKLFINYISARI